MQQTSTRLAGLALTLILAPADLLGDAPGSGQPVDSFRILDAESHHVRNTDEQEWTEFPAECELRSLRVQFPAKPSDVVGTLRLRQLNVKQDWRILLNDQPLGRLLRDENDIISYFEIPAGTLVDGENTLIVRTSATAADDIRVGELAIALVEPDKVLTAARAEVTVVDAGSGELLPCRITITRGERALQTVGARSGDGLAVRPGVIYCRGKAKFGLPPGEYTIHAGRGFEYGLDSLTVNVAAGDVIRPTLRIRREVDTSGLVSCDTHVHTLTHSGHGDASVEERMLTIAGEGIELPIATDHNVQIDYTDAARQAGVADWFTPVIGNEVTTKRGHFNVFPAPAGAPVPDHQAADWPTLFDSIYETPGVRVAILNHARDIHSGYRPFGPQHHLALTGTNLDGWRLRANAMEVINSAAQQTDMMQLVHDWFGMLNAGQYLTPVGSSDSHDVARHFVGQGRTYIRCRDTDPGQIDVDDAVDAFLEGRVLVSCGLLVNVTVNQKWGVGDVVPRADHHMVEVVVRGPSWVALHDLELFANGRRLSGLSGNWENRGARGGEIWRGAFRLEDTGHDQFLVAVARGPAVVLPYWPVARPYQPTSPRWTPVFMGMTGAVWLDGDGDGKRTPAVEYARALCEEANFAASAVVAELDGMPPGVATHAAAILHEKAPEQFVSDVLPQARKAGELTAEEFDNWYDAWRDSQRVRAGVIE